MFIMFIYYKRVLTTQIIAPSTHPPTIPLKERYGKSMVFYAFGGYTFIQLFDVLSIRLHMFNAWLKTITDAARCDNNIAHEDDHSTSNDRYLKH